MIGWKLEESDITWVNTEESGNKPYMVRLWTGSGYILPAFAAYAFSEEHALECVVAYLEKENDDRFFCEDYVSTLRQELIDEGLSEEEIDREIDESFYYVDATMEGANTPHWVHAENLAVYPYKSLV